MLISLIIILCILFLMFMLLFFSRVYCHLHYSIQNKQQQLFMSVSIYHIRLYHKALDISELSPDPESADFSSFADRLKRLLANVKDVKEKTDYILQQIRIDQLNWKTTVGSGDAFLTGIAAGAVWAVKGGIIGYIFEKGRLRCRPKIEVLPTFQSRTFTTKFECIVSLRFGQAMHTLLRKNSLFKSDSEN